MLNAMLPKPLRLAAEEHINALCEKHRIRARRTKKWDTSEADLSTRQVFIPAVIRTGTDYLASLHELGHIVDPSARGHERRIDHTTGKAQNSHLLMIEAAAWAWAAREAKPLILKSFCKADWHRIGCCWVSWVGPVW